MTRPGPVRVFQVATGNVGAQMIKRIVTRDGLELVGVHCYSPEKVGRDVGALVGIGPIGIIATGTIDKILAARPDCVTFHGVWPDLELYERVLEAGINVDERLREEHRTVTTATGSPATIATPTIAAWVR